MSKSSLKKYISIQKKVDDAQQEADRAEGAFNEIKKQLKESFGCSGLKAAKGKLVELSKAMEKAKGEFAKAAKVFEEAWHGKI